MSFKFSIDVIAFQWKGESTDSMYYFRKMFPEIEFVYTKSHMLRSTYKVLSVFVPLGYYLIVPNNDINNRFCLPYKIFREHSKCLDTEMGMKFQLDLSDIELYTAKSIVDNPPIARCQKIDDKFLIDTKQSVLFCNKRFLPIKNKILLWLGSDFSFATTTKFANRMSQSGCLLVEETTEGRPRVPGLMLVMDSLVHWNDNVVNWSSLDGAVSISVTDEFGESSVIDIDSINEVGKDDMDGMGKKLVQQLVNVRKDMSWMPSAMIDVQDLKHATNWNEYSFSIDQDDITTVVVRFIYQEWGLISLTQESPTRAQAVIILRYIEEIINRVVGMSEFIDLDYVSCPMYIGQLECGILYNKLNRTVYLYYRG